MGTVEVIVIGFFGAVACISLARRRSLGMGQLGRLFLPSWRLFDRDGPRLAVHVRACMASGAVGSWRRIGPEDAELPFDPQHSLGWGWRGLLAQLAADVNATEDDAPLALLESVAYRLVQRRAEQAAAGQSFQFKLVAEGDLLVSPVHAAR